MAACHRAGSLAEVNPCPAVHPGPPPGAFTVTVPAGPGFPGHGPVVIPPAESSTTPAFAAPGVFIYTVAGSPDMEGQIIVEEPVPTLSGWSMIAMVLMLLIAGALAIWRWKTSRSSAAEI